MRSSGGGRKESGAFGFGKAPHPVYPWEELSKLQLSVLSLKWVIRNFDWRLETMSQGKT